MRKFDRNSMTFQIENSIKILISADKIILNYEVFMRQHILHYDVKQHNLQDFQCYDVVSHSAIFRPSRSLTQYHIFNI